MTWSQRVLGRCGLLLTVGAVLLAGGCSTTDAASGSGTASLGAGASAGADGSTALDGRSSVASTAAEPVLLRLPSLNIRAEVLPVGTTDRVLDIPPEPWKVGWWRDGVRPGDGRGTVVLTAHLDSKRYGAGPFTRARNLAVGDPLTMLDGAGKTMRFEVARVETFRKTALPYEKLFRQTGPERVVFVTCGGTFDRSGGGWDSNVVVTFRPAA